MTPEVLRPSDGKQQAGLPIKVTPSEKRQSLRTTSRERSSWLEGRTQSPTPEEPALVQPVHRMRPSAGSPGRQLADWHAGGRGQHGLGLPSGGTWVLSLSLQVARPGGMEETSVSVPEAGV